jgi:hypothetical protein
MSNELTYRIFFFRKIRKNRNTYRNLLNIGHLTDSLWVSKNNVKTLYTLGFDENQRVVSLSNKTGLQRAFLHNAAGLLAAVEEQPTTKTFTYAAGLLSTLRYSSAAARTVASYAWRGTILNSVKSNGTTGEEEITYQISTEKANTLQQFFISQLGVLPVDFPLTTAYLLKSESHFFAGKTYGYEYAFEQDKITAITKSEQNGTTPKVVQKIEVSYY